MKKNLLQKGMLFAIIAILFTACDNEPLEGEFLQDQDLFIEAEDGQLRGFIDDVEFISEIADGIYYPENDLFTINGNKVSTGEVLAMGIFDDDPESIVNEGAYVFETGEQGFTDGLYFPNDEYTEAYRTNPIAPSIIYNVTVTEHNIENKTVSGTFDYNAARIEQNESGSDILVIVSVTDGSFTNVPYTIFGEEEEEEEISGEFFAKADDVDFIPVSLTTTQNTVGGIPMVNIVATNALGDVIRIDIPEDLNEGSYSMEQISDGTVLIGMYNPQTVGENLTSNPGTITILDINAFTGYIEAVFSFTATDPLGNDPTVVEITEGSFAVNYLPVDSTVDNNLFAQIDEEPYFPTEVTVSQSIFNGIDRVSMIARNTETNQTMGFFFPLGLQEGTYDMETTLIEGDEIIALYTPEEGVSISYTGNPGTFTITDYDVDSGVIEGTFEFIAIDDLEQDETIYTITNGEFSIMLQ